MRETPYIDNVVTSDRYYFGGFEYEANGTAYSLKQFPFSEGGILHTGSDNYEREYYMKDHLGNVRLLFVPDANNNITLTQEDYYYPFGLRISKVNQAANQNRYLYNGKELEDFANLNWYDYGARWYDPQLGRWHVVDPADEFHSPYVYVGNDPVNVIDIDGMFTPYYQNEETGATFWNDNDVSVLVRDGQIYKNIGNNYDLPLGNGWFQHYESQVLIS